MTLERARALAIQTEVLRAGHRDQHFRQLRGEQARAEGVFRETLPEALVRHVDVGNEAVLLHELQNVAPLLLRQIGTRRVVAGAVQQHDVPLRQLFQRVHHRAEVHAARGIVVIRIALELDARAGEQRNVVRPRRRADVNRRIGIGVVNQLGADAQRAAAARGLDRLDRDPP